MPKPSKGPRLGGSPANERKIIANLCKSLIENESIVTTEARARRVRPHMEKLITKAKKGDTYNRRLALKVLGDREAAYILFEELAPKFAERNGGYTRVTKLPHRKGDNAPMAVIEIVSETVEQSRAAKAKAAAPAKAAPKKAAAKKAEPKKETKKAEPKKVDAEPAKADDAVEADAEA